MKIFLTGKPGIGKTTICEKVTENLISSNISCNGVISRELRDANKKRIGFEFISIGNNDKKEKFLLSTIDRNQITGNAPRMGKYYVNLKGIEQAISILENSKAQILVVDELGPMELKHPKFKLLINELVMSERNLLLIVHRSLASKYFCIDVNEQNRNELPNIIAERFKKIFQS